MYGSRLHRHGPPLLKALLQSQAKAKTAWSAMFRQDLAWLLGRDKFFEGWPVPSDENYDRWASLLGRKGAWVGVLKRIFNPLGKACVDIVAFDMPPVSVAQPVVDLVRRRIRVKSTPPPAYCLNAPAASFDVESNQLVMVGGKLKCPRCSALCKNKTGLTTHAVKVHNFVAPEARYAWGAVCPSCLRDFGSRIRLMAHLAGRKSTGTRCFFQIVLSGQEPMSDDVLAMFQEQDTAERRALLKAGRAVKTATVPCFRAVGPLPDPLMGPLPMGTLREDWFRDTSLVLR